MTTFSRPQQLDAHRQPVKVGDTVSFDSDGVKKTARIVEVFGNGGLRLRYEDGAEIVRGAYRVVVQKGQR